MQSKFMAATGCLLAALALGVTACGDDERRRGHRRWRRRRGRGQERHDLLVAPAAGRFSRPDRGDGQRHQARARAGRQQGRRTHDQVRVAGRLDGPGRHVDAGGGVRERPEGRAGRLDRRLHRRVQLGRVEGLDPDPERGRRPADLAREHVRGPDDERPGLRARRAGQVLPDGRSHVRAHRPEGHDPGRGARHADEAGRLHQGRHDQRQGGLRRRPGRASSSSPPRSSSSRSPATTRSTRTRRTTARWPQKAKAAGADCFVYAGITANNAVQLYKDFAAALPDAKLYGPDGVAETGFVVREGRRHPGGAEPARQGDGRDAGRRRVPAGGPGVLHAVHREVRRGQPGSVRDLRLRGHAPRAGRDRALRHGREGRHQEGPLRRPRTARACSAPTRSTRTATRR